ncbi:MAG: bifunctional adenosylcobinamide kinase/adenosylcobinamide-phosphate guanylyltransferase [Bacillota bacterium]
MLVLITGGAASGKSEFAEHAAVSLCAGGKLAYIATMRARDKEDAARVEKHRRARSGKGFTTIESPFAMPGAQALEGFDTALVECASNLLANVMFEQGVPAGEAVNRIPEEIAGLCRKVKNVVVVTNEVFGDGCPYGESVMEYISALGKINRAIAKSADVVIESVCGIAVFLKGKGLVEL